MSVQFLASSHDNTLFGKPFPPDDVKAYWSLVPADIIVEWSPAFNMFFVTKTTDKIMKLHKVLDGEDGAQPVPRRRIMARDAHKLDVWMNVIAGLVNGVP